MGPLKKIRQEGLEEKIKKEYRTPVG